MNHPNGNRRAVHTPLSQPVDGALTNQSLATTGSPARRTFLEDFNMEHSNSNIAVKLLAFSAAAEAMEAGSRGSYAGAMPPPSCVFLG
jgi:hypothetical protein